MKRRSEDKPYRLIGANLKRMRIYVGLSQVEMGKLLGVSFQQIQKYETGVNRLPAYQLFVLQRAWGVPFDAFFEGVDDGQSEISISPRDALLRRIKAVRDNKTALKILQLMDVLLDRPRIL
ncbi:MAG: helix-turn-helix domain-containing protein [Alphaproteobacteria bacterium]|nr:helix-turn-helix domain-containing protein [Alphaproteobacteria bacterium]